MQQLTCDVCGQSFEGVRLRHTSLTTCSHSCRQRGYRARKRVNRAAEDLAMVKAQFHNPSKLLSMLSAPETTTLYPSSLLRREG